MADIPQGIIDAQPFDPSQLWVIAIVAACNVVLVEGMKALFLDGKRRARRRAVVKLTRAEEAVAHVRDAGASVPDILQGEYDLLVEDADREASGYNRSVGVLWVCALVASAGLGVFWASVAGWHLGYSALLGFLGGVFGKPLERYAEPAFDAVLRRFGVRKPEAEEDPATAGLPRRSTRALYRTATRFRSRHEDKEGGE